MAYTIHWEEHGSLTDYTGTLTNDDLMEVDHAIRSHPDFATMDYGIADFSGVMENDIGAIGVQSTAREDSRVADQNPDFRVAIIAPDALMRGFARMWELTGGGDVWETKIFNDLKSARAWLKAPSSRDDATS